MNAVLPYLQVCIGIDRMGPDIRTGPGTTELRRPLCCSAAKNSGKNNLDGTEFLTFSL